MHGCIACFDGSLFFFYELVNKRSDTDLGNTQSAPRGGERTVGTGVRAMNRGEPGGWEYTGMHTGICVCVCMHACMHGSMYCMLYMSFSFIGWDRRAGDKRTLGVRLSPMHVYMYVCMHACVHVCVHLCLYCMFYVSLFSVVDWD